ncbi:Glutamate/gamma-aminobutyrate antiporter [Chlamydia avium]|uniref:Amino acid permease family protein n=1 Tax=Chlamydia avium TaxID=1457141 RepID=A0ABN0MRK9_9CHLA|nr:amino acid permease [Chlamydia avium]EPP35869.1 amino acid permease family protein [Chlamydia psittaci 10_743_SC13]EPP38072.1 amino acid permease family protein [Chlamydia avium]VVT42784.1 Glutamate/gamma-aminobutyrate antiporter [Chlamydia avium]
MHTPSKSSKPLGTFTVGMLSLAVVISLRNLPLTAKHGLSTLLFYAIAVACFMLPYALISAELASFKPQGIYVWTRDALGKWWGFFSIWMQWFHNMTWYPAMLAFIASTLVYKMNPELAHNKVYLAVVILTGFWGLTFFNFLGINTSALFSSICVIFGTLVPGLILVSLAAFWIISGNPIAISFTWKDLFPEINNMSSLVLLSGMLLALCGLEANANLASDMINPRKNYPKAVGIGAIFTLAILVLGSLSIAIVIPKEEISLVSGLIKAFSLFFDKYNLSWMTSIIVTMTIAGSLGELNAWMLAGTKGLFISTQNDCLPKKFKKVNSKSVPTNLMLFQAIVVTIFTLIFLYLDSADLAYWILSALSIQMYLAMYICLFISGPVLRIKEPKAQRLYSVPGKFIGICILSFLGIVSCIFTLWISFLPPQEITLLSGANKIGYSLFLLLSFSINCLIPFSIYYTHNKLSKSPK